MSKELDIVEKLRKMECKLNNPISVLPNNFRRAKTKKQLFWEVTEVAAIVYLSRRDIESSMGNCDEKYGIKSPFSQFNTLNIFIQDNDSSITEIINDLLKTLSKKYLLKMLKLGV